MTKPRIPYWVDHDGMIHEVDGDITVYANSSPSAFIGMKKVKLTEAVLVNNGRAIAHLNSKGLHRLDGPAVEYHNGIDEYWVDGEIPMSILDILIIHEDIDHEMFPSSKFVRRQYGRNVYRITEPDELTLAILRYS